MNARRPRRPLLALALAGALTALTAACGEPEGEGVESLEGIADTLEGDTAGMVSPREDSALTAPVDSATEPAVLTVGGQEPDGWTTGTVASPSTVRDASALLTAVRTGRHDDYERIVLELSDQGTGIPAYHVEYVDKPLHACGSGEQIFPPGDAWLEIRMEPMDAHTQQGRPTVPHRPVDTPGMQNMLRIYTTCDFEAVTTLVVAVRSPNPFRAFHLQSPRRIVVDVAK